MNYIVIVAWLVFFELVVFNIALMWETIEYMYRLLICKEECIVGWVLYKQRWRLRHWWHLDIELIFWIQFTLIIELEWYHYWELDVKFECLSFTLWGSLIWRFYDGSDFAEHLSDRILNLLGHVMSFLYSFDMTFQLCVIILYVLNLTCTIFLFSRYLDLKLT
jgi:hypothetical protein